MPDRNLAGIPSPGPVLHRSGETRDFLSNEPSDTGCGGEAEAQLLGTW
jgi:hypothetical protein